MIQPQWRETLSRLFPAGDIAHPCLKFARTQIAEWENNDQELLQSQVGQE